jgi:hypothetical protein
LSKQVYLLRTLRKRWREIDPAGVIISCAGGGVDLNVRDGHVNVAEGALGHRARCGITDVDVYKGAAVWSRRFPVAAAT